MRSEIVLTGCAPTPLAHYLKGLGLLRVVGEQLDRSASGCWRGSAFVLRGGFDREGLSRFLLETYRPTAVVAPWNGGSGFYPKDNQKGIGALEQSEAERFAEYRAVLGVCRSAVADGGWGESPKDEAKAGLLRALRATLPDAALEWLDAAVLLADDATRYPPLLGTGGNDGRLDFTNNFMQRLVALFDPRSGEATAEARRYLPHALFGEAVPGLPSASVGQFAPGAAGGPNATTGFDADSLINPWDFVLMLEGALLFAAAATRRLESAQGAALSFPFTVYPTGAGAGSVALADEAPARAEMWLPLWARPAGLAELRALFSEGRATVHRRPARDGLDFARAVAGLGVDRGIAAFQRYAFLMRSGKAYLATPLNRVPVVANPSAELIDDLDRQGWLSRVRRLARGDAPARITSLVKRLDDALFDLVLGGGGQARRAPPGRVQKVLMVVGEVMTLLGNNPKLRGDIPPLAPLTRRWFHEARHAGDWAFLIAASIASMRAESPAPVKGDPPFAAYLVPLQERWQGWDEESNRVVWGRGALCERLYRVARRRLIEWERVGGDGAARSKPFGGRIFPGPGAIERFLQDDSEDARIAALIEGLAWVELPPFSQRGDAPGTVPLAYSLTKPLLIAEWQLEELKRLPEGRRLRSPKDLLARLHAGDTDRALDLAVRRLRAAGFSLPLTEGAGGGVDGRRLIAALTIPLSPDDLRAVLEPFDKINDEQGDE
ncbi:type I-G CRISPR-associated protein Cas8g1/Csx17 [Endothiovibrio diazotrophicus]